jgi:hypothetical protein
MNASKLATCVPSQPLSSVPDTAAQALRLDGETPGKAIQAAKVAANHTGQYLKRVL